MGACISYNVKSQRKFAPFNGKTIENNQSKRSFDAMTDDSMQKEQEINPFDPNNQFFFEKEVCLPQIIEKIFEDKDHQAHSQLTEEILNNAIPIEYAYGHEDTEHLKTVSDDRESIKYADLKTSPYAFVLRLEVRFEKNFYGGSATLISPHCALTSRRNILDANCLKCADSIKVINPRCNNYFDTDGVFVRRAMIFDNCDLAVLILDKTICQTEEHLKIKFVEKNDNLIGKTMTVIGFPWKNNANDKMVSHKGNFCKFDDAVYQVGYSTKTSPGQSGSPLLVQDSPEEEFYLVGIHSSGDLSRNINCGVVLNKERYTKIKEWIEPIEKAEERLRQLKKKWGEIFCFNVKEGKINVITNYDEASRVSDGILEELALDITISWNVLKKGFFKGLNIELGRCSNLKDEGLKRLISKIAKINNLESFDLKLKRCENLTDDGIKGLARQIGKNLKRINNLGLDFSICPGITDSGFRELAQQIGQNLKEIRRFRIKFVFCEKITDAAIQELGEQISQNLTNLEHLNINLAGCKNITDDKLKELSQLLKQELKKAEHVDIKLKKGAWDGANKTETEEKF